jgi:hypothetical protein
MTEFSGWSEWVRRTWPNARFFNCPDPSNVEARGEDGAFLSRWCQGEILNDPTPKRKLVLVLWDTFDGEGDPLIGDSAFAVPGSQPPGTYLLVDEDITWEEAIKQYTEWAKTRPDPNEEGLEFEVESAEGAWLLDEKHLPLIDAIYDADDGGSDSRFYIVNRCAKAVAQHLAVKTLHKPEES